MRMIGPFEIAEVLARGGTSVVHVARWREEPELDLVAKVAAPGDELRLHHENATMREVIHPSLLAPVAFVDDATSAALLLPRATCSLRAHAGRLGPAEVAHVMLSIASSLDALHRAGFAHGDVSPGNVLLLPDGSSVLADLGDARRCTDDAARADVASLASAGVDSLAPTAELPADSGELRALLERAAAEPTSSARFVDDLRSLGVDPRLPDPFAATAVVDEPPTMAVDPPAI